MTRNRLLYNPSSPHFGLLYFVFSACIPLYCIAAETAPPPASEPESAANTAESLFSPYFEPENPGTPCWRRPPPHCRWEIDFHFAQEALAQSASTTRKQLPTRVVIIHHGRESVAKLDTIDGAHFESWNLSGVEIDEAEGQLRLRPSQLTRLAKSPGTGTELTQATSSAIWQEDWHSLRGFHWVRPEQLRGTLVKETQRLQVYVNAASSLLALRRLNGIPVENSALAGLPLVAGIHAAAFHEDTLLPAMLQRDSELRTYKFTPLAVQKLEIPERITLFLENLRAIRHVIPRPTP